jgi:hypothetical protein
MSVPFLFNNGVLTLVLNGSSKQVTKDHPRYRDILDGLKGGSDDELLELVKATEPVVEEEPEPEQGELADVTKDLVVVKDGRVFYDGDELDHQGLRDRILLLQQQELPFDGMAKFIERLYNNVSFHSRLMLLSFIDRNGLTIDSEGYLIAYKAVRSNYMDKYSNKIDNSPGRVITMKRAKIDDDFRNHCSKGLHAGALNYVYGYGDGDDRIVIVKIDPADVVSVPEDCECQKLRTCRYEVIGDYQGELQKVVYQGQSAFQFYMEDEELEDDDVEDFDWSEVEEDDEEIEDDFFDEGDVQSECAEDCDCNSVVGQLEPVVTDEDNDFGVKPASSSQAGRKFWNRRDSSGRFA